MGIFTDLGFKKRNGVLVAPDSEKLGGETLSTIKQSFNPPILVEDTDSTTKTTTLPKVITQQTGQDNWVQYQVTANNVMGSVLVNGITQTVLTSPVTNKADFFGDGTNIATYLFDGNVNDARGTYNGTATSVTYTASGLGQAAVFNGTSSFISTTYKANNSTLMSVSLWFKTSITNTNMCLFCDGNASGADSSTRLSCSIRNDNTLGITIGDNTAGDFTKTPSILSYLDGKFHNLIITYNINIVNIYIDNILIKSYISTISLGTASSLYFIIGRGGLYNGLYFNGSIDQVRIFNRSLNQTEVTALYNEGLTTFTPQMGSTNSLNITTTGSVSEVNIKTWKLQ